jgi:hypothetical protein
MNHQLIDDFEFQEYVRSFHESSSRSRRVLYVLVVATLLIGLSVWNQGENSWPRQRVNQWMTNYGKNTPYEHINEKYAEAFAQRIMYMQVPVLGVSLDANDVALAGGAAMALLLILLSYCLSTEHENLCLGLFKVCSIHAVEQRPDDGNSTANLLYHALAMEHVVGDPPTLARWGGPMQAVTFFFLAIVFFSPTALHVYILNGVWKDAQKMKLPVDLHWPVLYVVLGMLFLVGIRCSLLARACSVRWRRTFYIINPEHQTKHRESIWRWLQFMK